MDLKPEDKERATEALREVIDPELGVDIVAMGLVYDIRDEDGQIVVEMTLTMPGCPVSETVTRDVRDAVGRTFPERPSRVELVWEPEWTPDRLSDEAAQALGIER